MRQSLTTMRECLVWAMERRGMMSLGEIYHEIKTVCARHDRELPNEWEAEVRQTLQAHCADSRQYKGGDDLFVWHKPGYWSCKATTPRSTTWHSLVLPTFVRPCAEYVRSDLGLAIPRM
ncbi:hypothetical protein ABIA03_002086 [Bradyrhizobium yuanmingense]|uniref:HTH HARE-type domain-containing protein n=1 Tax=Bradyrhizobium yuanmingense TaxID=108015 RepID=A0ABV4GJF6_9BRAD